MLELLLPCVGKPPLQMHLLLLMPLQTHLGLGLGLGRTVLRRQWHWQGLEGALQGGLRGGAR